MHGRVEAEDNIDGRFADNDLKKGTRGTRIEAREQNDVYFEIANAIKEANILFDGTNEAQLAEAIIMIARRESGNIPLVLELIQSPQIFNLHNLNIPQGNYLISAMVRGENPSDITLSYAFDAEQMQLILYSWYTNEQGLRVRGVPAGRQFVGWGKSFARPRGGIITGIITEISVILTSIKEL